MSFYSWIHVFVHYYNNATLYRYIYGKKHIFFLLKGRLRGIVLWISVITYITKLEMSCTYKYVSYFFIKTKLVFCKVKNGTKVSKCVKNSSKQIVILKKSFFLKIAIIASKFIGAGRKKIKINSNNMQKRGQNKLKK